MGWQERAKEDKKDAANKRKASRPQGKAQGAAAEYVGYVTYPRTSAQKAQYEAWAEKNPPITSLVDEACSMGFKYTLTFNPEDGSYKSAFYQADGSKPDAGLGISTFADNFWDSLALCAFYLCYLGGNSLRNSFFTQPDSNAKRSFWNG